MSNADETSAAAAAAPPGEELKPYKVHVSSRYLDLTRRKLELTRLPHERTEPKPTRYWAPKPLIEPLIDFWLEQYSWRDYETRLNDSLPQFRTNIILPSSGSPTRVHFIHARSPHANAVPLLLIPPFPFSNLSLGHLVQPLTDPDDAATTQPFHVVIPSLPGLGFSDALPNNTPAISTTAGLLDVLMGRLDYPQYIASNAGSGANSPAQVDWLLANQLATQYSTSCLGVHFISPQLQPPSKPTNLKAFLDFAGVLAWLKWVVVCFLQRPLFGYTKEDVDAGTKARQEHTERGAQTFSQKLGMNPEGAQDPNTLAYALCDSPVGLLLFFMMIFRTMGVKKQFSQQEIIDFTGLTWLPGPEGTLRYMADCENGAAAKPSQSTLRPKVAMTVFLGDNETSAERSRDEEANIMPYVAANTYACPSWANKQYEVLAVSRVEGQPGMIAWDRPEIIFKGARALAKAILAHDKRMQPSEQPGTALLEQIVVDNGERLAAAEMSGTTVHPSPGSTLENPLDPSAKKPLTPTQVDGHLAPPSTDHRPKTPVARSSGEGSLGIIDTDTSDVEAADPNESSPDTIVTIRQTSPILGSEARAADQPSIGTLAPNGADKPNVTSTEEGDGTAPKS